MSHPHDKPIVGTDDPRWPPPPPRVPSAPTMLSGQAIAEQVHRAAERFAVAAEPITGGAEIIAAINRAKRVMVETTLGWPAYLTRAEAISLVTTIETRAPGGVRAERLSSAECLILRRPEEKTP